MICLVPHCAYLSETSRMLAIYKALRARGANACIATHGGTYEPFLRDAGVSYHKLEPCVTPERCADLVRASTVEFTQHSFHTENELRAEVHAQHQFFKEHGVHMAVTGFTLSTLLSTRLARIPLATSYSGSFVPPVYERGILPAPSRPGPLLGILPKWLQRKFANWCLPRVSVCCAEFNAVAKELGIPGLPSFASLFLGDLTLVTEIPEVLGIPRDELETWTPKLMRAYRQNCELRYAGPIYAKLDLPIPDRVEAFLAGKRNRPLIYVAITSSPPALITDIIGLLRTTGARLLVLSTVHSLDACDSDDLLVVRHLPNHMIMPRVDLAVIAGGQGSVQTAMASGIPFVGIPLQGEQELNVHLAEQLGVGKLVPLHKANGPCLTQAVQTLLADANARRAVAHVRELYARIDGSDQAARVILEYLGSRGARQPDTALGSGHAG